MALGFLAQQKNEAPPSFPSEPDCTGDAPISISDFPRRIQPCHVFSKTYHEARQKFRQAATQVGAELHALPVVVTTAEKEEEYTIDIAILPGNNNKNEAGLLVHTSGVHGVEGYAGSAIQIAFLESIYVKWKAQGSNNNAPQLPTIILIHAVNPYGMAKYRRTNEHNVDLNRNGLHVEEWSDEQMIKATQEPTEVYAPYQQFGHFFNPQRAPTWWNAFIGLWTKAIVPLLRHGYYALKAAMVTGQYYFPRGIFYGGNQLEPSYKLLWEFFQDYLQNHNYTGPVTWIDVHTGLGKSGQDTIILSNQQHHHSGQDALQTHFPGVSIPQTDNQEAQSVQKGYEQSKGFAPKFFRRLFCTDNDNEQTNHHNYLGMVQEFGTVPGVLVAHALILENQAYQYLPPEKALEWAKVTTKRAFYKQTPEWRKSILERGLQLVLQGIQRSSSLSVEKATEAAVGDDGAEGSG